MIFLKFLKQREKKQKQRKSSIQRAAWEVSHAPPLSLREVKHHWQCWDLSRAGHINIKSREVYSGMISASRNAPFSWRQEDPAHVGAYRRDLRHFWICITAYNYFLIVRGASVNSCWWWADLSGASQSLPSSHPYTSCNAPGLLLASCCSELREIDSGNNH